MATQDTVKGIDRLLDDLYSGRDEISRDEIYRRVETAGASPEVTAYFSHLPEGDYTLDELVDEIGAERLESEQTGSLDLLG